VQEPPKNHEQKFTADRLYEANELGSIAEKGKHRLHVLRPQTRADCLDLPRPCPFVGCKYHLALDVFEIHGRPGITFNHPVKPDKDAPELWIPDLQAMSETCALDVIEGGQTGVGEGTELLSAQVALYAGLATSDVLRIEERALPKLRAFAQSIRESDEFEVDDEKPPSIDALEMAAARF